MDRSRSEFSLLNRHFDDLSASMKGTGRPSMTEVLCEIAYGAVGISTLRGQPVRNRPDRCNRFVVYPPAESVPIQLQLLEASIAAPATRARSFDAVVSLVALTNCHPFLDGNGRVARIVANRLLDRTASAARVYLPLREIAIFSRGGYILRVREAELQGNWLPLAYFLLAAVEFWALQIGAEPLSSPQ
ncbi:Fic family protein [Sphingomonas sp. H39-1-10]|uniref:Fic family protein n=1 Tax=Sphingomonas pollutisoli TaxID=3030829 RepID=UPI0023B90BCE|nr:Fic family protein [Sphingomonas pollutisoli]MDF0490157.1 Fic family protein [Sphingomonas pollutisoli]